MFLRNKKLTLTQLIILISFCNTQFSSLRFAIHIQFLQRTLEFCGAILRAGKMTSVEMRVKKERCDAREYFKKLQKNDTSSGD